MMSICTNRLPATYLLTFQIRKSSFYWQLLKCAGVVGQRVKILHGKLDPSISLGLSPKRSFSNPASWLIANMPWKTDELRPKYVCLSTTCKTDEIFRLLTLASRYGDLGRERMDQTICNSIFQRET